MVLVPSGNFKENWTWEDNESCVWSGPGWFTYIHRLQSINEYRPLQALFVNTVGLSDATLGHFLDFLEHIKWCECSDTNAEEVSKVSFLYDKFNELTEEGNEAEETKKVRYAYAPRF